ncbi:MAG: S41 family peptidase [Gemmatimonadales bacterium]
MKKLHIIAMLVMCGAASLPAQSAGAIDAAERKAAINTLAEQLTKLYVFPEKATVMANALHENLARGDYDSLNSGPAFAQRLTRDLDALVHDKHLRIAYSMDVLPEFHGFEGRAPSEEQVARARANHFGFVNVKVLPGNVGLLQFTGFQQPEGEIRDTAIAVMKRLAGVDALLVDLRSNGGGDPEMVALLSSQLFPKGKKVHLNDLYWRPTEHTDEFYTDPTLAVGRITGPVYTVTSSRTFSAAEEYTSNLKALKRATQVGETTGGGAHPGGQARLSDHYSAFIPRGRAINPITKGNWEGTGNVPEIATTRDEALKVAYLEALKTLEKSAKTDLKINELRAARKKLESGVTSLN